jgi:glycosyltransferase involved in cell wall biosynthesis
VGLALASCDIFTLASWYEGGRTLAVMEAQIFGKPCVVSGVGDLPLMVQNGIHGFVFSDGDAEACAQALESLLENASRRDEMGHAAREKALQEYGLNKMVQGYDQLYRSLL